MSTCGTSSVCVWVDVCVSKSRLVWCICSALASSPSPLLLSTIGQQFIVGTGIDTAFIVDTNVALPP